MEPRTRSWAKTDVGQERKHNEDMFLVDAELGLYIVADGMGGHAAGEVASRMTVDTVRRIVDEGRPILEGFLAGEEGIGRADVLRLLESSVQQACSVVHSAGDRDEEKRGMGTTVDVLLLVGTRGFIAHVGDSRVYLCRQGSVHQLTEDHSLINELLRRGRLTPEQAERVQFRNAVTRAVGVYPTVEVDVIDFDVLPGDRFLLCSDGLHEYLEESETRGFLENADEARVVDTLIDHANGRGGKDNITAVFVRIPASETGIDRLTEEVNLKLEVLHRMPLFRFLTYRELVSLLNYTDVRRFEVGQRVCEEGEQGDELYVVLEGSVRVQTGTTILSDLGSGEHFGELSLVDRAPRSATVVAQEQTQVLVLTRKNFFDLIRRDHELAVKLLWSFLGVLSSRFRSATQELGQV
ncbi:MAG: Stp1/IreP family PP2C-type Ser/Thr phosphatase, partial [Myxococcales bacterium]|nr:Stp1/IreP family PP2C-type Ser/Thr phosphatase [Myxococcales bacterium]